MRRGIFLSLAVWGTLAVHGETLRMEHVYPDDSLSAWGSGFSPFHPGNEKTQGDRRYDSYSHQIIQSASSRDLQLIEDRHGFEPSVRAWGNLPDGKAHTGVVIAYGNAWCLVQDDGGWRLYRAPLEAEKSAWNRVGGYLGFDVEQFVLNREGELSLFGRDPQTRHLCRATGAILGGGSAVRWSVPVQVAGGRDMAFIAWKESVGEAPPIIGEFDLSRPGFFLAISNEANAVEKEFLRYRISPAEGRPYGPWSAPMGNGARQIKAKGRYLQYQYLNHRGEKAFASHLSVVYEFLKEGLKRSPMVPKPSQGAGGLIFGVMPIRDSIFSQNGDFDAEPNPSMNEMGNSPQKDKKLSLSQDENNTSPDSSEIDFNPAMPDNQSEPVVKDSQDQSGNDAANKSSGPEKKMGEKDNFNSPPATKPASGQEPPRGQSASPQMDQANEKSPLNRKADALPPSSNPPPPTSNSQQDSSKGSPGAESGEGERNGSSASPASSPSGAGSSGYSLNQALGEPGSGIEASGEIEGGGDAQAPEEGMNPHGVEGERSTASPGDNNSPQVETEKSGSGNENSSMKKPTLQNKKGQGTPQENPAGAGNAVPEQSSPGEKGAAPSGEESCLSEDTPQGDATDAAEGLAFHPSGEDESQKENPPSGEEGISPAGEPGATDRSMGDLEKSRYSSMKHLADFSTGGGTVRGSVAAGVGVGLATFMIPAGRIMEMEEPEPSDKSGKSKSPWLWIVVLLLLFLFWKRRSKKEPVEVANGEHSIHHDALMPDRKKRDHLAVRMPEVKNDLWDQVWIYDPDVVCAASNEEWVGAITAEGELYRATSWNREASGVKWVGKLDPGFREMQAALASRNLVVAGLNAKGKLSAVQVRLDASHKPEKEEGPAPKGIQSLSALRVEGETLWITAETGRERMFLYRFIGQGRGVPWRSLQPEEFKAGEKIACVGSPEMLFAGVPEKNPEYVWIYAKGKPDAKEEGWHLVCKMPRPEGQLILQVDERKCTMAELKDEGNRLSLHVFPRDARGRFVDHFVNRMELPYSAQRLVGRFQSGRLVIQGTMQDENGENRLVQCEAPVRNLLRCHTAA